MKMYSYLIKGKEILGKFWRFLIGTILYPLKWYFSVEKSDKRYNKRLDKITPEDARILVAKGLSKYAIRRKGNEVRLHVADWVDIEDVGGITLKYIPLGVLNDKARMAYYTIRVRSIEEQEMIVDQIKLLKGMEVKKVKEDMRGWQVRDYRHTYYITYK